MRAAFVTILVAGLSAGCAATGTQLSAQAATQFTEGRSTEADVVARLGQPQSVVTQAGRRTLIYVGSQYALKPATFIPVVGVFAGGATYTYTRAIYQFSADGVLESVTHTEGSGTSSNAAQPAPMRAQEPSAVR